LGASGVIGDPKREVDRGGGRGSLSGCPKVFQQITESRAALGRIQRDIVLKVKRCLLLSNVET